MRITNLTLGLSLLFFSSSLAWGQEAPFGDEIPMDEGFDSFSTGQNDTDTDPDLEDDESLEELMQIEYNKDAWSMPTAIGLSLVPGGGFGLIYARQKPQAVVPFLLSTLGYGLGIAYLAGTFDESEVGICTHVRDGRVPTQECSYGNAEFDPADPDRVSLRTIDPRDPGGRPYFQTNTDYMPSTSGRNYSGRSAGLTILTATYVITSTLGAVWSGLTVRAHNKQLRRDIESTAQNKRKPERVHEPDFFEPKLELNGSRSTLGFTIRF